MQVSQAVRTSMAILLLGLCFGFSARAQNAVVAKIQTVSADKNKVLLILNSGASLSVGQVLEVCNQCEFTLQQVSSGKALANAEMCMDKNLLTVGQDVYVQGAYATPPPQAAPMPSDSGGYRSYEESMAAQRVTHRGIADGMAIFGSWQSTHATVTVDDSIVGYSDTSAQSLAAEVGYLHIPNGSIGFIGRLTAGSKTSGSGWSNFSYLRPEVSGTYGFNDSVYVLLGLNGTKYSGDSLFGTMNMGVGLQFGVGFKVHEHALFEVQYITSYHEFTSSNVDGTITLTMGSLALSAGYLF